MYTGNPIKTQAIVNSIDNVDSVIDIGCNAGYISEAIIKSGKPKICHGIDKAESIINPSMAQYDNFKYFVADITEFEFPQIYDVAIYVAVHHHIFANYGKDAAIRLWKSIANTCNKIIIFETGSINEVEQEYNDTYWIESFKKYYKTDQEQIDELLSILGNRFIDIEEILKMDIRKSERTIYKINLREIAK